MGMLGGFLGSMLFSSLGFAGYGAPGGGWGGPGLFDLLLLGGIGYLAYRWFSRRSETEPTPTATQSYDRVSPPRTIEIPSSSPELTLARGVEQLRVLDSHFDPAQFCDHAMDFFFRLQAAWSARDVSSLQSQCTSDVLGQLQRDLDQLRQGRLSNRVENIAVRTCELTEAWQETGQDFVTVYFYANCLDYDVHEETGEVVRGSKTEPGKFEEFWTFTRPAGNGSWKLSAITQA
jgi:predicted lipid-binding transport protein (Tim44 family)